MNTLNKVLNLGVYDGAKFQSKIRVSNAIGLLLIFAVATPFTIISILFFPTLAYLPGFGIGVACSIIILNSLRLSTIARLTSALVPPILAILYFASMMNSNDYPDAKAFLIIFSISFISILVFDLQKEWGWILAITLLLFSLYMNFDSLNAYFEHDIDDNLLREGWLGDLTLITSFVLNFGCILSLVIENIQSQKKIGLIVHDSEIQNKKLTKSEKKLNDQLNELAEKRIIEEQNNWIATGISNFSSILRENNDNLESLSVNIITNIIRYLEANQGAIFVINDNLKDPRMELKGTYAYNQDNNLEQSVEMREGLVGQCWKEKEPIHLSNVPSNYTNIASGLGNAKPISILLMPLKINETVYGVIEIASLKIIEKYKINFLEKVCENIASTLSITKSNIKTSALLEEAQQMSEQVQAQEEALRQTMEEMLSTQEEQERKIVELENTLKSNK